MKLEGKNPDIRLVFLIASQKLGERAETLFSEEHIPIQYRVSAKGTARGEVVDMLGLGGVDKIVTLSLLPKSVADKTLLKMQNRLYLGTPNTGVAFTIPLSAATAGLTRMMQSMDMQTENTSEGEKMDSKYTMIMAFVNQGFSEDVMSAAKPVGASGGTVFHSRRVENEESLRFWGIPIQQEREIVLILATKENKTAIMKAISDKCGIQSDAHGVVISLPVDDVAGLNKDVN